MDDFGFLIDFFVWENYLHWIVSTSTFGGEVSDMYYYNLDI